MPSYIQIDPCVPAVIPSPGSNGGISLDCVSTKTVTSTVDQTVEARYIDAESVQANQVSCTELIVGGKDVSTNFKNITANSTSTTIQSDLSVTGKTTTNDIDCLGDLYVGGDETVNGYLLVKGTGSQFEGSCYFGNGIYYNSAPLYPITNDYGNLPTGVGMTKTWDIPSWATKIRLMLINLQYVGTAGYVGIRFKTTFNNVGTYYGYTRGNNGDATVSWESATCMSLWNATSNGAYHTSYDLYKYNSSGSYWYGTVSSNESGYWTLGNGHVELSNTAVGVELLSTNASGNLTTGSYAIYFS